MHRAHIVEGAGRLLPPDWGLSKQIFSQGAEAVPWGQAR